MPHFDWRSKLNRSGSGNTVFNGRGQPGIRHQQFDIRLNLPRNRPVEKSKVN